MTLAVFGMQYRPFRSATWPILRCETAYIGEQNGTCRNKLRVKALAGTGGFNDFNTLFVKNEKDFNTQKLQAGGRRTRPQAHLATNL